MLAMSCSFDRCAIIASVLTRLRATQRRILRQRGAVNNGPRLRRPPDTACRQECDDHSHASTAGIILICSPSRPDAGPLVAAQLHPTDQSNEQSALNGLNRRLRSTNQSTTSDNAAWKTGDGAANLTSSSTSSAIIGLACQQGPIPSSTAAANPTTLGRRQPMALACKAALYAQAPHPGQWTPGSGPPAPRGFTVLPSCRAGSLSPEVSDPPRAISVPDIWRSLRRHRRGHRRRVGGPSPHWPTTRHVILHRQRGIAGGTDARVQHHGTGDDHPDIVRLAKVCRSQNPAWHHRCATGTSLAAAGQHRVVCRVAAGPQTVVHHQFSLTPLTGISHVGACRQSPRA